MTDLRKLSEAATPGEWQAGNKFVSNGVWGNGGQDNIANTHSSQRNFRREEQVAEQDANAALIVALVNAYRSGSLIPRSEHERLLALLAEARGAFGAVLALEDNTSPFGGELMHDRIERTLDRARAILSRIDDALAAEPEAKS